MTQEHQNPADAEMELQVSNDVENMTNEEVLQYTLRKKMEIVETLTSSQTMSTEAKDITALVGVLNSIDKSAMGNIRNNIEQAGNANTAEAIAIMASMQAQMGNHDPFMIDVTNTAVEPREVSIEETLVETTFVDGELSHEVRDLQYDSFVEKYE